MADLNEEQRRAVRARLDEMIAKRANGSEAATLTAALNIGVGVK